MAWREKLREHLKHKVPLPPPPSEASPVYRVSSVLIPIGWNQELGRDEILLTKRTMTVETHKGQISFPGGLHEAADPTLLDTALRESKEEIGADPSAIEVLGPLSPVITRGEVIIYPWVGRMAFPYPFSLNEAEVARLLHLPLLTLLNEGLGSFEVPVGAIKVKSPGIYVDRELVWGATAKILEELRACFLELPPGL